MKKIFLILIVVVNIFAGNMVVASGYNHTLIPKFGIYQYSNSRSGDWIFDTKSDDSYAFEYEYRFSFGLTIGTEYMHFKNNFTDTTNCSSTCNDELEMEIAFFIIKYYFRHKKPFKPYIGAGTGYGTGSTKNNGGAIDGKAYQYNVGLAYEWERVGIYFEYRKMYSTVDRETINGWPYTLTDGTQEINISGDGIFSGVSVKF